jgi:hypothetical protein
MMRPVLSLLPQYPSAYAVLTHFAHLSRLTKLSADSQLTYQLSLLHIATYPLHAPRTTPGSSVPSLNHRRGCAQLLTILLQFYHCERSIKQKIAPAHHLRYFDIGSDLFGTRTSTRLACFCAHVLPVYIRIPSFPPAPFALRLGLEHTRYLSQNRIAP